MNNFIEVFDVEYNIPKKINVDHIVGFYQNISGTGRGQILLSTGKQLNTQETPKDLSDKIREASGVDILPVISGPSHEEIIAQMSKGLAQAVESLREIPPAKAKKGKAKETSSPEQDPKQD